MASPKPNHLCVLVHGLWGVPSHLDYLAAALRERYDEDHLHILAAKANSGNFTYDGVELGGERLAHEIEDTLDTLAAKGCHITKLSFVGYSLGGLVARYALGLLYARGWFDKLEPVNFTTFASPHVGVRKPSKGFGQSFFNILGARTVSMSGRQIFMVDSFRDTGRPLLSVLADPESIFIQGLAKFKNRSVYANVVNDRTTIFYSTAMSTIDPFDTLEDKNINYVKGYEPVVIDPDTYFLPPKPEEPLSFASRIQQKIANFFSALPFWLLFIFLVPIFLTIFLVNAMIQTFRSRRRIRLHEEGKTEVLFGSYRVPVIVKDVQNAVENAFETAIDAGKTEALRRTSFVRKESLLNESDETAALSKLSSHNACGDEVFPTLALTPAQFSIIESLNSVGFRKYPVYIHNVRHSHAAIIVRMQKESFYEGKIIVNHWLDNEFEI